jgi:hypothetical protein
MQASQHMRLLEVSLLAGLQVLCGSSRGIAHANQCLFGGGLYLSQILASVVQLTEQEWQYTLTASCIEVYNNQLR